jgi:hypothetical protein
MIENLLSEIAKVRSLITVRRPINALDTLIDYHEIRWLAQPSQRYEIFGDFLGKIRVDVVENADVGGETCVVQTYPIEMPAADLVCKRQDVLALPFTEEKRQAPSLWERRGVASVPWGSAGAAAGAVPGRDQRQPGSRVAKNRFGLRRAEEASRTVLAVSRGSPHPTG